MNTVPKSVENQQIKLDQNIRGEQQQSGRLSAQEALKQLQQALSQGDLPGTQLLNDCLLKAEQVLNDQAQCPNVDLNTQKTLEDLAKMVGSAKQLSKHKDLGDRVKRIAEETKKALTEVGQPGVPVPSREATQQVLRYVEQLRPLFKLLIGSREFRVLIIDSLEILRRIIVRQQSDTANTINSQFLSGYDTQNITQNAVQNTIDSFQTNQVEISDEEWTDLQDVITRVLATLASNQTYQKGVDSLFDLVDMLRDQIRQTADQTQLTVKAQPHARRAREETEGLIASFSGQEALDDFVGSLRGLVSHVDQDEKSRSYLWEVREFINFSKSPEYIQGEEFKQRSRKLANEARDIVREYKYSDEVDLFLNHANELMENIRNDEYVEVLRQHAGVVADDLSYVDNTGKVKLDIEMLTKLRGILAPILAETLKYVPIPRIENCDKNREFWVDNIVLCAYDTLPDHIRVQLESDNDISVRDIETKYSFTRLVITLKQIRTEIKDLEFYYKRKIFPEMADSGRVNLSIGGTRGATLKLVYRIEQKPSDKIPKFREGSASFNIHKFDMTFDKSTIHHNVLLPMITQIFKSTIQQQIESEVEKSLEKLMNTLGDQLTEAMTQVNRPLMNTLEEVRKVGKSNEFAQTYERRQEKLLE